MKKSVGIVRCSVLTMVTTLAAINANAAIRVGNLSRNYAGTYKNTAALEQQYYDSIANTSVDTPIEVELPVRVANAELADQIRRGVENESADIDALNRCAMIYPEGEFEWAKPTIGRGAGGRETCVAVVEMRARTANSSSEIITARGKMAVGDAITCNISSFPASSYLPDIASVVFPADRAPTREDVIRVLNEEQKQKAGIKIAAAAVIGALGGNVVGKNDPNQDGLLGTSKSKLATTAAGAAIGAAVMTASTMSGKVAGDVILHGGVNAAAGGIVGNMMASGDSVLRVESCKYNGSDTKCLWGNVINTATFEDSNKTVYYDFIDDNVYVCKGANSTKDCERAYNLIVDKINTTSGLQALTLFKTKTAQERQAAINDQKYIFDTTKKEMDSASGTGQIVLVDSANVKKVDGAAIPAVIVNFPDSAFGTKTKDWYAWKSTNAKEAIVCKRDTAGNPSDCTDADNKPLFDMDKVEFRPYSVDPSDGDVVDFTNKARLGSTLKGAGIGGALGGFSGYQGAQSDIEERFSQATAEYNGSLEKFYCATGRKFLEFYNSEVILPAMPLKTE